METARIRVVQNFGLLDSRPIAEWHNVPLREEEGIVLSFVQLATPNSLKVAQFRIYIIPEEGGA